MPAHIYKQPISSLSILLSHSTHQYDAAVISCHTDGHGSSAEARYGDLPSLQPPDQSLDRTGLAPPLSSHCGRLDPGQGHQGSTGEWPSVVVPSPSEPSSLIPWSSTNPSCDTVVGVTSHTKKKPAPPGLGPSGVYRRVAVGGGAVPQLAVGVVTPALDRAGSLLTATLSEPALHQIASASSLRLAFLHVNKSVLVIPQGAGQP